MLLLLIRTYASGPAGPRCSNQYVHSFSCIFVCLVLSPGPNVQIDTCSNVESNLGMAGEFIVNSAGLSYSGLGWSDSESTNARYVVN